MTPEEKAVVTKLLAEAWDDGFEHCRSAAILVCSTSGREDLADIIRSIPLVKP